MPGEELYDLVFDPNERNNLVTDRSKKDILNQMRSRLDKIMKETNDPMQNGFIVAPPDAVLNDPDDISPTDKTYTASDLYKFNNTSKE